MRLLTTNFWTNNNPLDEVYSDITVEDSVSCSPLKYVVHISSYQQVQFRAKALFLSLKEVRFLNLKDKASGQYKVDFFSRHV